MSRLEEIKKECEALGLAIEDRPGLPPRLFVVGHIPLPTHLLDEFFHFIEELAELAHQRSHFIDSGPQIWWDKLSERAKQSASDLFNLCMEGYARIKKSPRTPIISSRYVEVSPEFLLGGWYSDEEIRSTLWVCSLFLAGLFDGQEKSAADILQFLIEGFRPFISLCEWLETELQADLASIQAFTDFLIGRSAAYTGALLEYYLPHTPTQIIETEFKAISEKCVREVLISPSLDPAYPKSILRLLALSHNLLHGPKETTSNLDEQLREFIRQSATEVVRNNPYYEPPVSWVANTLDHDPYKILLLSLLEESRITHHSVKELAERLQFDGIQISKDASRLRTKLRMSSKTEDPTLTFLRKIGLS